MVKKVKYRILRLNSGRCCVALISDSLQEEQYTSDKVLTAQCGWPPNDNFEMAHIHLKHSLIDLGSADYPIFFLQGGQF